jgi:hypothetical protein
MPAEAELEDTAECVDHVRPRPLTRPALAISARDLGDRGDNPSVLAFAVDGRDLQRFAHDGNGSAGASDRRRPRTARTIDGHHCTPTCSGRRPRSRRASLRSRLPSLRVKARGHSLAREVAPFAWLLGKPRRTTHPNDPLRQPGVRVVCAPWSAGPRCNGDWSRQDGLVLVDRQQLPVAQRPSPSTENRRSSTGPPKGRLSRVVLRSSRVRFRSSWQRRRGRLLAARRRGLERAGEVQDRGATDVAVLDVGGQIRRVAVDDRDLQRFAHDETGSARASERGRPRTARTVDGHHVALLRGARARRWGSAWTPGHLIVSTYGRTRRGSSG